MKGLNITRLAIVALMSASISMTACSTLKSIYPGTSSNNASMLKKKVLAAPVVNMSEQLNDQKAAQLTETWLNLLRKDQSLLITPLTGFKGSQSATSSQQGVVVDPSLIKKAEDIGMNILVIQLLEPLNYSAKKRGIWPFRTIKGEYEVAMVVDAVDIINGTLILSTRDVEALSMGHVPEGQQTPLALNEEKLKKLLDEMQEDQASTLLKALSSQDWKGEITLDAGKIRINGGADVGITMGSVFEVFAKGEAVKSITGKEYYAQGMKVGEITVTDVSEDHSFVVPVGDTTVENGQIIKLKVK